MLYRFDKYELDTSLFELRHVGIAQRVEPQVFDVLAYLPANSSPLITKDELLEKVWGDKYISEATLNSRLTAGPSATMGETNDCYEHSMAAAIDSSVSWKLSRARILPRYMLSRDVRACAAGHWGDSESQGSCITSDAPCPS
jgi:hypothetical protein